MYLLSLYLLSLCIAHYNITATTTTETRGLLGLPIRLMKLFSDDNKLATPPTAPVKY